MSGLRMIDQEVDLKCKIVKHLGSIRGKKNPNPTQMKNLESFAAPCKVLIKPSKTTPNSSSVNIKH